jgi:hypothetical protein
LQGGLLGKGGVLWGEAAPGGHLRRGYSRAGEALSRGEYWKALKEAPKMGTLGYASNLGFGYGFPAYLGYEAYRSAEQEGQNPLAALGASSTAALGDVLMAPLGVAQMHLYGPMERGAQMLWGVDPPKAKAPTPVQPPMQRPTELFREQKPAMPLHRGATSLRRRLQRAPSQPSGYQAALYNSMSPETE